MATAADSESFLGRILGDRRKEIVLATKFAMPMDEPGKLKGGSRRYIMSAINSSLRRLKTDWVDLYQFHCPDPLTPIEETLRALDDLIRIGKVRYVGCSKFAGWQVADAYWTARVANFNPFIWCQEEYSLLAQDAERELIPAMKACGLGLLPCFPARERATHRQVQTRCSVAGRQPLYEDAGSGKQISDGIELDHR